MHFFLFLQDTEQLIYKDASVSDISALVGQVANQLPEGYGEYDLAISLVDLVHTLS